jgi:5-oxoprolinase (ATP-hydrolysing) subunit A
MQSIDINVDLGEGGTEDEALLAFASSANIACGGHAGDESTMQKTIALAKAAGVAVGAHPGYEDRAYFGRRAMVLSPEKVTALVHRQIATLHLFAQEAGVELHHVKPHGALYNQASRDPILAAAVVRGILGISPKLILYTLPQSALAEAGIAAGLTVHAEGFADRRYREDGTLMPRGEPGALIKEVDLAVAQALEMVHQGIMQTLCVHGDGASALEILKELRKKLDELGVQVAVNGAYQNAG